MIKIYSYEERPLSLNAISILFKESFNQEFDEEYWKWRFLNNPNSKKNYIVYAEENKKIVAYYAVSPMIITDINSEEYNIALSNMTMTHPKYQGKGLFTTLANKLFEILKSDNFVGVYGFANPNSHYGFRKNLGWIDISLLNIFKLKKKDFRDFLLAKTKKINVVKKDICSFDFNTFNNFFTYKDKISIKLDKKNIKWRFCDIPNKKYSVIELSTNNKLESIVIYKEFGDEIDIMEVFHNNENNNDLSLIHAVMWLVKKYSKDINIWSNLHSTEHLLLEKYGFKEDLFNTYFGFIPFDNSNKYLDSKDWHFRFTDSDIF